MGCRNKFGMTLRVVDYRDRSVILNLFQDLSAHLFNFHKNFHVCCLKALCIRLLPSIHPTASLLILRFSLGYSGSGFRQAQPTASVANVRKSAAP